MKILRHFNVTLILALLLAALLGSAQGDVRAGFEQIPGSTVQMAVQGTAFTYQGQLKMDGMPIDGDCDFQFALWDAAESGSQVGSIQTVANQPVSNGYFIATLDFGSSAFDGQARWLEVSVLCPSGSGSYTSLGRQLLTAAPYALYSLAAGLLDGQEGSYYQNASNLNAGALSNERFSAYSDLGDEGYLNNAAGNLAQNTGALQATLNADLLDGQEGSFYQNATNLNAGMLSNERFSAYSDLGDEGYLNNAAGNLAQNTGALQETLNADRLDGVEGSDYQQRVSGSCALGSAISAINEDGTVECEPFTIFSRNPLDVIGDVGQYASLVLGNDGLPLISYYDVTNQDLKVAHCTNADCSEVTSTTVDNGVNVGLYTNITIGGDGFGLISYYDQSNGDLRVAHCTNTDCSSATSTSVDSIALSVGLYTSITTGSDGFGLISYYDQTNANLKVAHCTNATCTSVYLHAVDSTGDVGEYTSITLGGDGFGLISYYDQSNGDLKVAHCTDANCSGVAIISVDTTATSVGLYTSITTGNDGFGLISYYDQTNANLKIAHCTNANCTSVSFRPVDSTGNVGEYTSITTGSDGFGLVSYYDNTNGDLKVAHCNNADCFSASVYVLDSGGVVGQYTGIILGSDELGLIIYYDLTNADLLVAHCDDVWCKP